MLTEAIVASVIAGSSVCSDHFDNVSRFNPTELSDYQQCVLAAHSDESAGVLGSIFWTKVGNAQFVSMPVSTLRSAGSKEAAKEIVIQKIIEEVVVERIVEVTVENGETIDRLRGEIRTLQSVIDGFDVTADNAAVIATAVAPLNAEIRRKSDEIMRLMGLPTYLDGHIAGFSSGVVSIKNDVRDDINNFFGMNHATYADAINWLATAKLEDGHRSTVTQRTGINVFDVTGDMTGVYYNQTYVDTAVRNGVVAALQSDTNVFNQKYIARAALAEAFNASIRDLSVPALSNESLHAYITANVATLIAALPAPVSNGAMPNANHMDHVTEDGDASVDAALHRTDAGRATWSYRNGGHITVAGERINLLSATQSRGYNGVIEAAVEKAYDIGYADGYENGYNDGYAAGYADGVNSVTLN